MGSIYFVLKVYTDIKKFKAINPVVTIGTFDGVHRGHQKVLARLNEIAKQENGESVLFTFYPHPRLVISPNETNLRLLTTFEEKKNLLEKMGIDHLIVYPFTKEFSSLSYSDFVKTILVDLIKTKCLVIGYDHKFGKNREGGYEYLKKCADKYNFGIEKLEALLLENVNISSTIIREALESGNIEKANEFLDYQFTLNGNVVEGKKLGRTIGFPTANIESSDLYKLIPNYGVYAVQVYIKNRLYNGMLNIGTRPTFNKNADNRSIEVNIFDFDDTIYGETISVFFVKKIRDEQKFDGADSLIEQLKKDKTTAQEILSPIIH